MGLGLHLEDILFVSFRSSKSFSGDKTFLLGDFFGGVFCEDMHSEERFVQAVVEGCREFIGENLHIGGIDRLRHVDACVTECLAYCFEAHVGFQPEDCGGVAHVVDTNEAEAFVAAESDEAMVDV